MAATAVQQDGPRRERGIIDRPRLTKMLDECEARVILLLAPAGYGKTTLARQWVKTLSGAIWVSATPAHRDVVTLSEDLAAGIDALGGNASKFIREYLSAQSNPQRSARGVARALADQINKQRVQWIVIDDYHELVAPRETSTRWSRFFTQALQHDSCSHLRVRPLPGPCSAPDRVRRASQKSDEMNSR